MLLTRAVDHTTPCGVLCVPHSSRVRPHHCAADFALGQVSQAIQHLANNTDWPKYPILSAWCAEMREDMNNFLSSVTADTRDPPFR